MADTFTPHYNLDQPSVGGDSGTWGGILNSDLGLIDTGMWNAQTLINQNQLANGSGELSNLFWGSSNFASKLDTVAGRGYQFVNAASISANSIDVSNKITIGAAEPVTLSGYVNASGASAGRVAAYVTAYNSSNTSLGVVATITTANGTGRTYQTASGTTPAGTAYVTVTKGADTTPTVSASGASFDQLKLEAGSQPTLFSYDQSLEQIANVSGLSQPTGFRNLFHNPRFQINIRSYVSGTNTTASNQYTLDRWRVVTSGQNITFANSNGYNTVTCPAGGFEQAIPAQDMIGGSYTVSWQGTATCQYWDNATPGTYFTVTKGQTITLTGGHEYWFRWSSGTFWFPQLEAGTQQTAFEVRPYDEEQNICAKFACRARLDLQGYVGAAQAWIWVTPYPRMRGTPTSTLLTSPNFSGNVSIAPVLTLDVDYVYSNMTMNAAGAFFCNNYIILLSCDL
jgi:hypothetical protein